MLTSGDKSLKLRRIKDHYTRRIDPLKASHDVLDWGSSEAQSARFEALLDILQRCLPPLQHREVRRLLDVGCGLADLCNFFEQKQVAMEYIGVDITLPVLKEAHRRCPGRMLAEADVFVHAPFRPQSFDAIFCSGIFNLRLGNNRTFAVYALRRLLPLSRHLVVANFLHERTSRKYGHCYYYNPAELQSMLNDLPCDIEIIDDYLENDFTIVLKHHSSITSAPPADSAQM